MPQSTKFVWRYRRLIPALLVMFLLEIAPGVAQPAAPMPPSAPPAVGASTPVRMPQTPQGSRGSSDQIRIARQEGVAETAVLDWVLANSGPLKGDVRAGQMRVAFTITPAEGWWDKAGSGRLAWHDAPDDAVHLRVFVMDLVDGRIVPGLTLRGTLTDQNGNEQSVPLDFGWYPLINAYGGNISMDTDGTYILKVAVDAVAGPREGSPAERVTVAEFSPVLIALESIPTIPLATTTAYANEAELLKPCNAAFSAAITAMWQQSATGAEKPAGDYFVAYGLGSSEMALQVAGAKLHPKNLIDFSGKQNARLTIVPRDSRTGRLIPNLRPQASLIAADGKTYGPGEMPLVWHPWINRYERETRIAHKTVYKLRVHFDAPGFRRWGRESERFAVPADVEFADVSLKAE